MSFEAYVISMVSRSAVDAMIKTLVANSMPGMPTLDRGRVFTAAITHLIRSTAFATGTTFDVMIEDIKRIRLEHEAREDHPQ
jgi:hypothetical protein